MLVTDREALHKYTTENRLWQGIPSIEVTKKGRIFACFYSGNIGEKFGNFSMVVKSDDGGAHFTEPIAVAVYENGRSFDPCLWIDPLGRLWFTWAVMPGHGVRGVICEDPDADELCWGEEFFIGHDVLMNKPIVTSDGRWLFPLAVWDDNNRVLGKEFDTKEAVRGAFAYETTDCGKTFRALGAAQVPEREFDENMILELRDGRLAMFVRTKYGIGVAYSQDGGLTWSEGKPSGHTGPGSRFHIRRLASGNLLLINHMNFTGRNNLTALLSEDDGKTWPWQLLLDGRKNVSYPDVAEGADGFLYIIYDRERGASRKSLEQVYADAREVLFARITEADIKAGALVTEGSKLQQLISKLGKYAHEEEDPYGEKEAAAAQA